MRKRKPHLIWLEVVCRKKEGGLRIVRVVDRNSALVGNWSLRFPLGVVCWKKEGGLGILRMVDRNSVLVRKWSGSWRFPLEQEALWAEVMRLKFDMFGNNWDNSLHFKSSLCFVHKKFSVSFVHPISGKEL